MHRCTETALTFKKWFPATESKLPRAPFTHIGILYPSSGLNLFLRNELWFFVGVGGFVVNSKNEILVVHERLGLASKLKWSIPGPFSSELSFLFFCNFLCLGGRMDPGEYVHEAAMREVKEETGVLTEFVGILAGIFDL